MDKKYTNTELAGAGPSKKKNPKNSQPYYVITVDSDSDTPILEGDNIEEQMEDALKDIKISDTQLAAASSLKKKNPKLIDSTSNSNVDSDPNAPILEGENIKKKIAEAGKGCISSDSEDTDPEFAGTEITEADVADSSDYEIINGSP